MTRIEKYEDFTPELLEQYKKWITFWRRNPARFVQTYLNLNLYLFQSIMITLMFKFPLVVLLCARAVSKSYTTTIFAVAYCMLYPGSKVLVTSMNKKQAGLLITEKLVKELMPRSPAIRQAIKEIKTGVNDTEVIFKNNSSFITSVSGEGSRGLRSTILVIDEFRLVKKEDVDEILVPTMIQRPVPYLTNPESPYIKDRDELIEEPRQLYLSSAFWKSHWMWDMIRLAVKDTYVGKGIIFSTDYFTTLYHGIKTRGQMIQAKKNSNEMGWLMEYCNIMIGGAEDQYYSYDLISHAQVLKKAWYPRTTEEYFNTTEMKKNKRVKTKTWFGDIPVKKGEIRIVTCDIALSDDTKDIKNDYSVFKCIRALLDKDKYERQEVYIESLQGVPLEEQAIRMRQLMDDFEANYLVIDARTFGITIFDELGKILYDPERDIEYDPIKCMNDDHYANRCKNSEAIPIVYAFVGTPDRNDEMHKAMKSALTGEKYKMLISHAQCKDEYLDKRKEYKMSSFEDRGRYEQPYIRSDMTLHEMINLSKDYISGGKIRLSEPSTGTKDSYIASAMGNYFISEKETELTVNDDSWDEDMEYVLF